MDILHAPVYEGRPTDPAGRLEKELRTYDLLDSLQIPYLRIDHEALPTIEACRDVDTRLNTHVCKNLFLCNTQKKLILPAYDAWRKEISNETCLQTIRYCTAFLCTGRIYGTAFGFKPRLCQCPGTHER